MWLKNLQLVLMELTVSNTKQVIYSTKIYGVAYFWTHNGGQVMYQQGNTCSSDNYAI